MDRDLVLDAGALIALERRDPRIRALVDLADRGVVDLLTSATVVAQVWRGGAKQAPVARLLASDTLTEFALDSDTARDIGVALASANTSDVVDAHVVLLARRNDARIVTSDADDIAALGVDRDRIIDC